MFVFGPNATRSPRAKSRDAAERSRGKFLAFARRGVSTSLDTNGKRRRRASEDGFTLVELMVVIVIIGLLATVVVINVMPAADRAAVTKARADISTIEQALQLYRIQNLRYPTSEEGLQALVAGNQIPRLPNDPWNNPYTYAVPGPEGRPFLIASLGADGREGGEDENADITN